MLGLFVKIVGHIVSNSSFTDDSTIQCHITSTADETVLNALSFKEYIQHGTLTQIHKEVKVTFTL